MRTGVGAIRADDAQVQVTLDLRDIDNQPVRDPETFFTFRRVSDNRQLGDQVAAAVAGSPIAFSLPGGGDVAVCEIDARRYRLAQSPLFFRTPGTAVAKTCQLMREPREWQARFAPWDGLPAEFADLKRVLSGSRDILKVRTSRVLAPRLAEASYDAAKGDGGDGETPLAELLRAKAALLNLYFVLSREMEPIGGAASWFSFVRRIIAFDQERFLAFVDPAMATLVSQINEHIGQFPRRYERTPADNHRANVPPAFQSRIHRMVSIKSADDRGNVQLTVTVLNNPTECLLDVDIDENGNLLRHTLDLFKHRITGGTHPHDIYEILQLRGKPFDPGYELL